MSKSVKLEGNPFSNGNFDFSDKQFIWVDKFDEDSTESFFQEFLTLEKNPAINIIPIFISSYGGEVFSLIAMRDLIKSSMKPVATIAIGKAMSCGVCLLAAGTKGCRFASADSMIMIHQISSRTGGKTSDIIEDAAMLAALNNKVFTNLAKDTGKPLKNIEKTINSKNNADWSLTVEEAKKWGIIDHIAIPRMGQETQATNLISVPTYDSMKKMAKGKKP